MRDNLANLFLPESVFILCARLRDSLSGPRILVWKEVFPPDSEGITPSSFSIQCCFREVQFHSDS